LESPEELRLDIACFLQLRNRSEGDLFQKYTENVFDLRRRMVSVIKGLDLFGEHGSEVHGST